MHSSAPEETAASKLHSSEISIDLRRVIDNDVSVLVEFITQFSEQMHRVFMQTMFETLEQITYAPWVDADAVSLMSAISGACVKTGRS